MVHQSYLKYVIMILGICSKHGHWFWLWWPDCETSTWKRRLIIPPTVTREQHDMNAMQYRAKNPVGPPSKKYWKVYLNNILQELTALCTTG